MKTIDLRVVRDTPQQLPPVSEFWQCQKSGDCCTIPAEVVMTSQERSAIMHRIADDLVLGGIKTEWRIVDKNMVALKAAPCPFFLFKQCSVYEVRPYNCRRFACMRPDPKAEPFTLVPPGHGELSGQCANVIVRLMSQKTAQKLARRIQRTAQRWAVRHGWGLA